MSGTKNQSVAPTERVNITYKPSTGDAQEEIELPLKILSVGDYTGRASDEQLEDRKPVNIDKDNFNQVLAEQRIGIDMSVKNELSTDAGAEMAVHIDVKSMKDFGPEGVVAQVPELQKLLELRSALAALKGALGNVPAFRKRLEGMLRDEAARTALMAELGMGTNGDNSAE